MSDYHQDRALLLERYVQGKIHLYEFEEMDARLVGQAFNTAQEKGLKDALHARADAVLRSFPWISRDDGQHVPDMDTKEFLQVVDEVKAAAVAFLDAHTAWERGQQD
jgi:hypothetical protein